MFKRLFSRSRMTRECPVRFYEGPQGLTKGSTHQKLLLNITFVMMLAIGVSVEILAQSSCQQQCAYITNLIAYKNCMNNCQ